MKYHRSDFNEYVLHKELTLQMHWFLRQINIARIRHLFKQNYARPLTYSSNKFAGQAL